MLYIFKAAIWDKISESHKKWNENWKKSHGIVQNFAGSQNFQIKMLEKFVNSKTLA